ncbi:hypothetical protein TNCV_1938411 [Trichonephila clavipes]|nr:hypothetical protein TNCV_1938411 [Trichonephila clavipes]
MNRLTPEQRFQIVQFCFENNGSVGICIVHYVQFFKNNEGHNVTVNGDRYKAMITNFFIPELNNHDVQELWFQQDGIRYTATNVGKSHRKLDVQIGLRRTSRGSTYARNHI